MLNYIHRDAHYGNFLYQENNEIGYYHYIFNGKNYYLKSCKYNIMIYDFGFANEINNQIIFNHFKNQFGF
jgi:predicted unusual protein kinase regulating ubiquinone biosynthesis (AarF/ABC1/UbiB family)